MNLRPLANSSVLTVAVAYGLLLRVAASAGFFGVLLGVCVSLSLLRYAYGVLRAIAQGRVHIPAPGLESMNPFDEVRLIVHCGFFAVALYFLGTTALLGEGWVAAALRWGAFAVLLGAFPASAALMGFTSNPAAALNPVNVVGVIRTFADGYARLLLACLSLALFTQLVPAVLGSGFLATLLRDVATVWGFLAVFAMIGAAIRERRAEFDIPGEVLASDEWQQREREQGWQKTLDLAYGSIRSGLVAEGYRTIKQLCATENDSVDVYQWVFNRMLTWQDQTHALQFAGRFVERLIEEKREHSALELVAQCRRLSRDFSVSAQSAARLAEYARAIGRHAAADEIATVSLRAPRP